MGDMANSTAYLLGCVTPFLVLAGLIVLAGLLSYARDVARGER